MLGEKRTFFLHHSLHASLLQVTTDGLRGDGLVLDILKGSGNLDSIFSLSSSNKLNGMAYISRGNEGGNHQGTWLGQGEVWSEFY